MAIVYGVSKKWRILGRLQYYLLDTYATDPENWDSMADPVGETRKIRGKEGKKEGQ